MNKAFIFDMDGVFVNSEAYWAVYEHKFLPQLFGEEIAGKIGDMVGRSINDTYTKAKGLGYNIDIQEYYRRFDEISLKVYAEAEITPGIEELADKLQGHGFKLALVSSSPQSWIDQVLARISFYDKLEVVLSIHERNDLRPKPEPDGYIDAMKHLNVSPEGTIVLEDSNPGIAAGKAAGAFTIGLKQNLKSGYQQIGADAYADKASDVIEILQQNNFL